MIVIECTAHAVFTGFLCNPSDLHALVIDIPVVKIVRGSARDAEFSESARLCPRFMIRNVRADKRDLINMALSKSIQRAIASQRWSGAG